MYLYINILLMKMIYHIFLFMKVVLILLKNSDKKNIWKHVFPQTIGYFDCIGNYFPQHLHIFFLFIINYRGPTSGYGGQVFLVFGEDGPSKWGLDLIDQWQKGMILEVFAKMAMASFVLVIPYTPLPFPCAGCTLEYSCKY